LIQRPRPPSPILSPTDPVPRGLLTLCRANEVAGGYYDIHIIDIVANGKGENVEFAAVTPAELA
jgi:hypothetical protein